MNRCQGGVGELGFRENWNDSSEAGLFRKKVMQWNSLQFGLSVGRRVANTGMSIDVL